jgi:hypothetical protein
MFHFQNLLVHVYISPQQRSPPFRLPSQSFHIKSLLLPVSKSPRWRGPLSKVPQRAPMERDARHQSLFYMSFKVPNKGAPSRSPSQSPDRERERDAPPPEPSFTSLSKSPWRSPSSKLPQRGPYEDRHPSQSLLLHISRRPNEKDLIKIETHLSKSPVKEPPFMFPDGVPMERDAPFHSLLLHISLPEEPQSPFLSQSRL